MVDQNCYDAFWYGQEKEAIEGLRKMKGDPREMKYWYNTTILHFAAYRGWFEALQLHMLSILTAGMITTLHRCIGPVNTDIQTL